MALVCFLHSPRNVVPQPDAVVEVECQDISAIGTEADVRDGWVVFVDQRSEALPGGGVPHSAEAIWLATLERKK